MPECRKCHKEIYPEGRDGRWTDDPENATWGDICIDGTLHEPDEEL